MTLEDFQNLAQAILGPDPMLRFELKPCPCCEVLQTGFPIPSPGGGGETTSYAGASAWVFRMDLFGWVCPDCHTNLGPDHVRENAIAQCKAA